MDLVSVIIPTYDRFRYLLNTIESVKKQTHTNIEIVVINDASQQKEYYEHDWGDVIIVHLPINSKKKFGFGSPAHVRNKGLERAKGKYVAFCDDDDIWFPKKLELQIEAMKSTSCKMSSTDGLLGRGVFDKNQKYRKYNAEIHLNQLKNKYKKKGSDLLDNGFPKIWTHAFLRIHNCMICSSVILEKSVLDKMEGFTKMKPPGEDYDCWLRALKLTDSVYLESVCFYYDACHGEGRKY